MGDQTVVGKARRGCAFFRGARLGLDRDPSRGRACPPMGDSRPPPRTAGPPVRAVNIVASVRSPSPSPPHEDLLPMPCSTSSPGERASSGLIFVNSYLLNEDGFHSPMTLCSMGLGASWTISYLLVSLGVSKMDKSKDVSPVVRQARRAHRRVRRVLPGAGQLHLPVPLCVSFIQMLKAAVPCVTMLVLVGTRSRRSPHRMTVLGVAILTFGTALAAYGEIAFQWIGIVLMFSSEFSEAFGWPCCSTCSATCGSSSSRVCT